MNQKNESFPYEDILYLPHPVSQNHPGMPRRDRAAQFAAFRALTGFEEEIGERGRFTESRLELADHRREELDWQLRQLMEEHNTQREVELVWFQQDERKAGGQYRHTRGTLWKYDAWENALYLREGTRIPLKDLYDIRFEQELSASAHTWA